ncbi:MAG TPA: electron transfer flavoprotein subunit beta/FixA family protein [Chloroflexota bacterium]|nr:electron transfer flavoprotein subunit beta/FixA family protein [Chloroflexota bacterium]
MNIVVCIKQVPDPDIPPAEFKVDEAAKQVVPPPGVAPVISTFDLHAVEAALQLKEQHGGRVTVLSLGGDSVRDALKRALAMGCDAAVHLQDPAFEGGDSYATAVALAAAIRKLGAWDLVLTGRQASDWDSGQVPMALAELLDVPGATPVQKIEVRDGGLVVERVTEDGYQPLEMPLPAVLGISNEINQPRYPTLKGIMAAGRVPIPVWGVADLGLTPEQVGVRGSRLVLERLYVPVRESRCEFIEAETGAEAGEKLALRLREARLI